MKLEIVLIAFVTILLVAAVVVKQWEKWEHKKQNEELKTRRRQISSRKRK